MTFSDGLNEDFQNVQLTKEADYVTAAFVNNGQIERGLPFILQEEDDSDGDQDNWYQKVKKDPWSLKEKYYDQKNIEIPRRIVDVRPNLLDFQTDFGKIEYERSPKGRVVKTIGIHESGYQNSENEYDEIIENGDELKLLMNTKRSHVKHMDKNVRTIREYSNAHGQLVKTESFAGMSSDEETNKIVSKIEMDILDRPWVERSPMNVKYGDYKNGAHGSIDPVTNRYNSQGWLIEKKDPDAGKTETLYDKMGNIRFFRDENLRELNKFIVNMYDNLNRLIQVLIVEEENNTVHFTRSNAYNSKWPTDEANINITVKQKYYYGKLPQSLPDGITEDDFRNYQGKLTSSYANGGAEHEVRKFMTYDNNGRIKKEWIKIMLQPLHCVEFEYNIGGQIVEKKITGKDPNGVEYTEIEKYSYNELNRLHTIKDAFGAIKAKYTYWHDGKVRYIDYGKKLNHSIAFKYDIAGRLEQQVHLVYKENRWIKSDVYEQSLLYNRQGNISRQDYKFSSSKPKPFRSFLYKYDDFNRLTLATFGKASSTEIDYSFSDFDGVYNYNIDGALTGLGRGRGSEPATYNYKEGTHQLKSISGLIEANGVLRDDPNNYQYDKNGNIIVDKALCRKISYDYRNLPVRITTFTDSKLTKEKTSTVFVYDESGNRVLKYEDK